MRDLKNNFTIQRISMVGLIICFEFFFLFIITINKIKAQTKRKMYRKQCQDRY